MATVWIKTAAVSRRVWSALDHPRRVAARVAAVAALWLSVTPSSRALEPARALTQYQTRHWGSEDGLPCNNVLAVTQTADGYLWLGTEEGLVRFDGVRTEGFDRLQNPLAGAKNISEVFEDATCPGRLLFLGSSGSLRRFANGKIQRWTANTAPTHQPGRILVQNPADGTLWVGTVHGLFRVGPRGETTGPDTESGDWPTEEINTLCLDATGRLWVGSAQGIYRQREPGNTPRFDLQPDWKGREVNCVAPAQGGGVWVGSRDAGIGRIDDDGTFHPRTAPAGWVVSALFEDDHGMLWTGTVGKGLYRLPVNGGLKAEPGIALTTANGLVDNQINGLCEDREGNLWIATERGLQVLRDARFVTYAHPEGAAGDDANTVYEDRRNQLWVGTSDGLSRWNPSRTQVANYPTPPSPRRPGDSLVLCVGPGDAEDTLLVGTHTGLLLWHDDKLEELPLRDDLDGSAVRALCVDAAGDRWIGTSGGLYRMRDGQVVARLTTKDGLADNLVRALHFDPAGNLWIATDGGVSRRSPDGRIVNFLTGGVGSVLCFEEEPVGMEDLFVGTESGLYRLHTAADGEVTITNYTMRDGLFDNTMWCLLDDKRGNLWMSSNRGITRVSWVDLIRFDHQKITTIPHVAYDVQDGLRSREGNGGHQPVAWRDRTGALWFATVKGAVRVDPALALLANSAPPPVRIEELKADGQTVPLGDTRDPGLPAGTRRLELRYTALSLTAPQHNRFRYRLVPFDKQWTDAGTERVAHYTNLPPGDYRFQLRAANGDGVWNEVGEVLPFTLQPHLYQVLWVQLLAGGGAVGLGLACFRRHRQRLVARVEQAEADVRERIRYQETLNAAKEEAERARAEAERASNAKSDFLSRVSHELRTPLNAILGFGQLLELDDLTEEQSQSVGHILLGGRHLLGLVNEVLDLASIESGKLELDIEDVEIGPLLRESVALVSPIARARGVRVHLDVLPAVEETIVRGERRRLKQVLINLLDNAVKYNRATDGEVFIDARTEGENVTPGTLRIDVRDTGTGMSAAGLERLFTPFERLGAAHGPIKGTGLGLAVSKQLVERMGGNLRVTSEEGRGSTFSIDLPLGASPDAPPAEPLPIGEVPEKRQDPLPDATLLYIEDNPSNLQVVKLLLGRERPHWHFLSADQGSTGLELARQIVPSLILLDLQLPGISGEEVLRTLRQNPETHDIPVIVLSADATRHSRERLLANGANAYLTKPLDLDGLLTLADATLKAALGAVS